MKLYYTPASPFARKVRAAAIELGLEQDLTLEIVDGLTPFTAHPTFAAVNPLLKVPALALSGEGLLVDSPVICAYLQERAGGEALIPAAGPARWRALSLEALADGIMDAGVLIRLEGLRPEAERSPAWVAAQSRKIDQTLDWLEAHAGAGAPAFDLGALAVVCAVEWLTFRGIVAPLAGRDRLGAWVAEAGARPALLATRPG